MKDNLLMYLPLIAVVLFMIILTVLQQKKQKKRMEEMQEALKVGVKVRTAGGFIGTMVAVTEATVIVELRPDNVRAELLKRAVAPLDEPVPDFQDEEEPVSEEEDAPTEE